MRKSSARFEPICTWCKEVDVTLSPYRATDSELPGGVGWVVCSPSCPERPNGPQVFTRSPGDPWVRDRKRTKSRKASV